MTIYVSCFLSGGHERFLYWLRQYGMHDPPTILLLEAVRVVFVKGKLRIPVIFMTSVTSLGMGSGDGFGGFHIFRMEGDKHELSESSEPTLHYALEGTCYKAV